MAALVLADDERDAVGRAALALARDSMADPKVAIAAAAGRSPEATAAAVVAAGAMLAAAMVVATPAVVGSTTAATAAGQLLRALTARTPLMATAMVVMQPRTR